MAVVSAGLMLMTVAAVKAQFAYARRFDGVSVSSRLARSAILYGAAGAVCFVAAKMTR